MCAHGVLVSSEDKIKAQKDAATSYVRSGNRRDTALTHNRVFIVEGETGAAGHERIVAIPEGQRINVPKVAGVGRQSLTRHADQLVSVDKNELRVDRIVRLDHAAIPDWSARSRGEIGESGGACAKKGALSGVGVHGHEIEFLDVPETIEARAVEGFLAEAIDISDWDEVVDLVQTAVVGKCENALFGDDVVEFELADFDVEPTTAQQIVEAHVRGLEVECSHIVRGRHQKEADVFCQCACGEDVHAGKIETMCGELALCGESGRGIGDVSAVDAFAVPIGSDTKGDRPVRRLLKNGSVAVVHHLVAVIFEGLPKIVELGPRFMTSRAAHAVFTSKGRDGADMQRRHRDGHSGPRISKNKRQDQESENE